MRLQVFLSRAGICSRRAAKDIIRSGKVRVNGKKVLEPSFKIDLLKDGIFFNDKRIQLREKAYVIFNKPKGVTTTKRDPFAKKTVMDFLLQELRHLNPVGRLDRDTRGLLLLTNDGELINKLTHPGFNIEKVYSVDLDKRLRERDRIGIEKGIDLDGRYTAPCKIRLKSGNSLEITLHEGRKRQIKRMFSKKHYRVTGLKRLKEGTLGLGNLPEGRWRPLTREEILKLRFK